MVIDRVSITRPSASGASNASAFNIERRLNVIRRLLQSPRMAQYLDFARRLLSDSIQSNAAEMHLLGGTSALRSLKYRQSWDQRIESLVLTPMEIIDRAIDRVEKMSQEDINAAAGKLIDKIYSETKPSDLTRVPSLEELFLIKSHGSFDVGEILNKTWGSLEQLFSAYERVNQQHSATPRRDKETGKKYYNSICEKLEEGLIFLRAAEGRGEKELAELENMRQRIAALEAENNRLRQENEQLCELSITDRLTGLRNRGYFNLRLNEEFQRAGRDNKPFSVLILDIDHFKHCNDKYGHDFGDRVLREISQILRDCMRQTDLVGRYGGEEFGIILPNTSLEGAVVIAERIRKTIEAHSLIFNGNKVRITASIGVTTSKGHEIPESIVEEADNKLYAAKNNGRNQIFYKNITEYMNQMLREKLMRQILLDRSTDPKNKLPSPKHIRMMSLADIEEHFESPPFNKIDVEGLLDNLILALRKCDHEVIVTVPMRYLEEVRAGGLTARSGFDRQRNISGTIGRKPHLNQREDRFICKVRVKPWEVIPRLTGEKNDFTGVVVFEKAFIPRERIEIILP